MVPHSGAQVNSQSTAAEVDITEISPWDVSIFNL